MFYCVILCYLFVSSNRLMMMAFASLFSTHELLISMTIAFLFVLLLAVWLPAGFHLCRCSRSSLPLILVHWPLCTRLKSWLHLIVDVQSRISRHPVACCRGETKFRVDCWSCLIQRHQVLSINQEPVARH